MKNYIGTGSEEYRDFDNIKSQLISIVNNFKSEIECLTENSKLIDIRKVFDNNTKNYRKLNKLIEMIYEVKTINLEKDVERLGKYNA